MTDTEKDRRQAVALFRYGLIAEFLHQPEGGKGLYARLREKAAASYTIPGSRRTRVALETLRDWLKRYRQGGFDALLPKPRTDRGRSRALSQAIADALLTIKDEKPDLSIPLVIKAARDSGAVPDTVTLPPSTVHRLFTRHGLMRPSASTDRDRRAASPSHTQVSFG